MSLTSPSLLRKKKIKNPSFTLEKCSSLNKKHFLPTEWMKVPSCELTHVRYFQRELTHACYKSA